MRMPIALASATFAFALGGCAVKENVIALELRYRSDLMLATCSEQAAAAEKNFRQKWVAHLFEPSTTTVVQSDAQRTRTGPATLAPVGSYQVVFDEWTLTNRLVSVFVNCEKREGYVRARGGVIDQQSWFGPYRF